MPTEPPSDVSLSTGKALRHLGWFVLVALVGMGVARFTPLGEVLTVEAMTDLSSRLGWAGVGLFFVLGVVSPLLFLPRWPIAFAAGLLYGIVWGTTLAVTASCTGAVVHYYLSRTLLSPMAEQARRQYGLDRLQVPPTRQFHVIFLLRAFPFSSFVVTNLLAGAMRMHSGRFIWASLLGMIPSTLMYASGGKLVKQPDQRYYVVAMLAVAVMAAGSVAAYRILRPLLRGGSQSAGEQAAPSRASRTSEGSG